jgi:cell division protein FtsB
LLPEHAFELFDEYAAAYARGERPDAGAYLERAGAEADELARLRAENRKLMARNDKLENELGKTRTALDIAGKAFALLEDISNSADSGEN